jgi:hypothetical protein
MSDMPIDSSRKDDLVITPGGPRPKDQIHLVGREETVQIDERGKAIVSPRKEASPKIKDMDEDLVPTPGGYRSRSLVHLIDPGHVLHAKEGHLLELKQSKEVLADFGPIALYPETAPGMPEKVLAKRAMPPLGSGWIVYAYWRNNTGNPITSFRTTWVVPPAPANQSGQIIYLFNGIENSIPWILQPVLQWRQTDNWSIGSWYVKDQNEAFNSPFVHVEPGDTIVGIMTLMGQLNGLFSYKCEFQGFPQTVLTVENVQELTWCSETLEAYGRDPPNYPIESCSDYPDTDYTALEKIDLKTGEMNPTLNWTPVNRVTDCGQHAIVVSNANPGGEVDIYYRNVKPNWVGHIFKVLAWAWLIVIGALLITPGGVSCIKCGASIEIPGYIGDNPVLILGLGAIILGIAGLASEINEIMGGSRARI